MAIESKWHAHSLKDADKGKWQPLREHLTEVARLSRQRGEKFGAGNAAEMAGLFHDLGKYTPQFQQRLAGGDRVDHATAGGRELLNLASGGNDRTLAEIIAHAIVGHHAGLPNSLGAASLADRLKKKIHEPHEDWRREISADIANLRPETFKIKSDIRAYQWAFFGRMIFSCLIDADRLNTEEFILRGDGEKPLRGWPPLWEIADDLLKILNTKLEALRQDKPELPINRLRQDILEFSREKSGLDTGLFTFTAPTGGGKTLASLAFALAHAKKHKLDRIVYAIPFTSIIDQTAKIFKDLFCNCRQDLVLEHHSGLDGTEQDDQSSQAPTEARARLNLAMEDWAAPIIVTTNVQIFESLHSHRPTKCRRLHNLAKSVIILDEAQTIPLHVLRPCLRALDELALNYGASIVLCTATQPAVKKSDHFKNGLDIPLCRELAPKPDELLRKLQRAKIEILGKRSDEELTQDLRAAPQGLVIVNSRKHALKLYRRVKDAGLEGVIHLTTRQYAAHRRRILGEIGARLKDGAPCRVIATSLVEAGVDLDFPKVWRAEAGLEQIVQAAGRCNREGRRPLESSIVGVFRAPDDPPPHEIQVNAVAMARVSAKYPDILSLDAVRHYFQETYWQAGEDALDKYRVLEAWRLSRSPHGSYMAPSFDYRRVSEDFRLIESRLAAVVVAIEEAPQQALTALRGGAPAGLVARRLQPFIVQIPLKARENLIKNKDARFVEGFDDQFAVLRTDALYHEDYGLLWNDGEYLNL